MQSATYNSYTACRQTGETSSDTSNGLQHGRAEVLRGFQNFLSRNRPGQCSTDCLKERQEEKWNFYGWCSWMRAWMICVYPDQDWYCFMNNYREGNLEVPERCPSKHCNTTQKLKLTKWGMLKVSVVTQSQASKLIITLCTVQNLGDYQDEAMLNNSWSRRSLPGLPLSLSTWFMCLPALHHWYDFFLSINKQLILPTCRIWILNLMQDCIFIYFFHCVFVSHKKTNISLYYIYRNPDLWNWGE